MKRIIVGTILALISFAGAQPFPKSSVHFAFFQDVFSALDFAERVCPLPEAQIYTMCFEPPIFITSIRSEISSDMPKIAKKYGNFKFTQPWQADASVYSREFLFRGVKCSISLNRSKDPDPDGLLTYVACSPTLK